MALTKEKETIVSTKSNYLVDFDEHGLFEIRDDQLLKAVSGGGELSLQSTMSNGTCVNPVCASNAPCSDIEPRINPACTFNDLCIDIIC